MLTSRTDPVERGYEMAVTGDITSSSERPAVSLKTRILNAWMRLQALHPGAAGMAARTTLRLRKELGAHASGIRVTSDNGYVELRGTVSAREISDRAAAAAKRTMGARGVLNFLVIR
jgi:hypothetical protein